jgi:hypothetical protein
MKTEAALVLLFNKCSAPHLAARVHAPECNMVNAARRSARKVSMAMGTLAELQPQIDDLNDRDFPVLFCKCCKT